MCFAVVAAAKSCGPPCSLWERRPGCCLWWASPSPLVGRRSGGIRLGGWQLVLGLATTAGCLQSPSSGVGLHCSSAGTGVAGWDGEVIPVGWPMDQCLDRIAVPRVPELGAVSGRSVVLLALVSGRLAVVVVSMAGGVAARGSSRGVACLSVGGLAEGARGRLLSAAAAVAAMVVVVVPHELQAVVACECCVEAVGNG